MQIEIDFEVFKALTALRESEADSYNSVVRRLLELPDQGTDAVEPALGIGAAYAHRPTGAVASAIFGAWFENVNFPPGTKFRATYKGRTYFAEIRDRQWVGEDGVVRSSPSAAASAITGTNVNGWRFWYVQLPNEARWRRMDELKK